MNVTRCWVCGYETEVIYESKSDFSVTRGCKRCNSFLIDTGIMGMAAKIKSKWCTNNNAILQSELCANNKGVIIPLKYMYRYCMNKRK